MALHWTQGSPSQIAQRLASIADQVPPLAMEIATDEASRAESEMKERAPWTDRTSQARGGLFGKAEQTGDGARIHIGGTMEYQPFLELGTRRMKPYPIIKPVHDETKVEATEQLGKAIMELFR
jgi:HK97 gp10 family phage protein